MTTENTAWVSWLTRDNDAAALMIIELSTSGKILKNFKFNGINPSRTTGFPQLTKHQNGVMIAWTDIDGATPKINTFIIN